MSLANKYYIRIVHGKYVHRFIVTNYYAQRIPNIQFAFGLFSKSDKKMIGVISFGQCPTPYLQIGCSWTIIELNRIALIKNEKNIISWWMSNCFKQLPKPLLLVSYADQNQKHIGYVYQVTNWIYTNVSVSTPMWIINGKILHGRYIKEYREKGYVIKKIKQLLKHRYFYPLGTKSEKRKMREYISQRFGTHSYPKGESKKYNMADERIKKEAIEEIKGRLF